MAVGFALWARELPDLDFSDQWVFIVLAGAGAGLVLGPANTDAINRAPRTSYGEATGITQTVRNFGSSVGLAVLGSILVLENRSNLESSLGGIGIPTKEADKIADAVTQGGEGSSQFAGETSSRAKEVFGQIQVDYALASRTVFYAMAGAMAVAFVVALVSMPGGKAPEQVDG
jgi:hypothetical protein